MCPNHALTDGMSVGTFNIALRGFVLKENIRLKTQFVLCKIKIGRATV
jgi:hypothetical protein